MGGKRPRQSHGVSVLPDDAGVVSVAKGIREKPTFTPLKDAPARTWRIWAGGDAHPPPASWPLTPPRACLLRQVAWEKGLIAAGPFHGTLHTAQNAREAAPTAA
jgi:hypothetical protein